MIEKRRNFLDHYCQHRSDTRGSKFNVKVQKMPSRKRAESGDLQFQIKLSSTVAGSVRIQFMPRPPLRSLCGGERKLAVVIYTLAAEFERRSDHINADWVVVAEPFKR